MALDILSGIFGCFAPSKADLVRLAHASDLINSPKWLREDIASAEEDLRELMDHLAEAEDQLSQLPGYIAHLQDEIGSTRESIDALRARLAAKTGGAQ